MREGCYLCHSQMIRALRDEVERYGHYSLAAESQYDHPFQWGSKRNGPDLARVGGKYSDDWHARPSEGSAFGGARLDHAGLSLAVQTNLDFSHIAEDMKVQALLGVPYTDEMIANATRRRAHAGDQRRAGRRRAPTLSRRRRRAASPAIRATSPRPTR